MASILEEARANVVRAVNHNMVLAYWLIGREIVVELQRGKERAGYGERVVADLSKRLTVRFGKGYSVENLFLFKKFYSVYATRDQILYPSGTELEPPTITDENVLQAFPVFLPQLTWSHYRALMRVDSRAAREHYETEAAACGWSKRDLERQIYTHAYERMLATQMNKRGGRIGEVAPDKSSANSTCGTAAATGSADLPGRPLPSSPLDTLKDPYVLEFLLVPETKTKPIKKS
ncbi:MAG TPA: DUF1016 N-terminal domain-containing protein [Myxococcota bacterium]|nr:DUF1016 N-terminal domain-containing protein [Myxococcota bacterium]